MAQNLHRQSYKIKLTVSTRMIKDEINYNCQSPKKSLVFLTVIALTCSRSQFLSSLIFVATSTTNAGSLRFPRWGTGAKYGQSVSISNRSKGILLATSCSLDAFLKVTGPAKE